MEEIARSQRGVHIVTAENTGAWPVTHAEDAPEEGGGAAPWASRWRMLTPHMEAMGGRLNVVQNTLPPGSAGCPFHWHLREDEVFFVLSGRGVLRYGERVGEIRAGDCISCPAGTQVAHQIANPFDEDLVYLAIGPHDPHEVCGYPDNGKVMVRAVKTVGRLEPRDYLDGEPDPPKIFDMT